MVQDFFQSAFPRVLVKNTSKYSCSPEHIYLELSNILEKFGFTISILVLNI